MSGGPEFDTGGGGGDDCDIRKPAAIGSPIASEVRALTVGEYLDVVLVPNVDDPLGGRAVLQKDGRNVGAPAFPGIGALIRCLTEGHRYRAKVTHVRGSTGDVTIEPA